MTAVRDAVAAAHETEWASVVAATVRVVRDLDLAEECVQEAYLAALVAWERDGVPARPGAWLTTAARRRAIDAVRRAATLRTKLPMLLEPDGSEVDQVMVEDEPEPLAQVRDDTLRLVFLCCHPSLTQESQVALTLRLVCGVETRAVARLFLVSEGTMTTRITRAKKKVAAAGLPFALPAPADLRERLDAVLGVVYLLFTAGYNAPGDAGGAELQAAAVRLARSLQELLPGEPEAAGLLALVLATHARRETRVDAAGALLRLDEQDRSRWDRATIAEADALVRGALRLGRPGRYVLQGAIATLHALAPSPEATDWTQIVVLYDELFRVWPTPVVALNRCVALARVDGPEAALAEADRLAAGGELDGYHYLPALRADLLEQLGRAAEARAEWARAHALATDPTEVAYLAGRAGLPEAP